MLSYLAIRDFAIIHALQVELVPGFCVLTGETGAGKSILVQALHLLLGGRAATDMIRTDTDAAEVEAVFRLPDGARALHRLDEMDLRDGDQLAIRRVVSRSGRSRAFVNGRAVTLSVLGELTRGLVDISGQHEHVELIDEETHREVLDDFGGLGPERAEVGRAVRALGEVEAGLAELETRDRRRAEREELLRFWLARFEEVAPRPGEDEALVLERDRLRHVERLQAGAQEALESLYDGEPSAVDLLGRAGARLEELLRFDPGLETIQAGVEGLARQAEDLARDLRRASGGLEADPDRLQQIEDRLAALRGLVRAHGPDLRAAVDKWAGMRDELAALDTLAGQLDALRARRDQARERAVEAARRLSARRRRVAERFAARLVQELEKLAMRAARVEVEVRDRGPEGLDAQGMDDVRLMLSANPGEDLRPLARVASGGELSRVLLALKAVLAEVDRVPTYVFDEVDSGVGGAVAEVIGAKLAEVAARHQVVCITHLPQIAAHAAAHYTVTKSRAGERTVSDIRRLSEKDRIEELARMAGGRSVTEQARRHARQLLQAARDRAGL